MTHQLAAQLFAMMLIASVMSASVVPAMAFDGKILRQQQNQYTQSD